jgi:glucose/arabinose dehydrogenase
LLSDFSETLYASGISRAVAMQFAPDGRLFVCQQSGALRVIENGVLLPTPFVTVNVNDVHERGLLGIAFDPGFATNQWLYVHYTTNSSPAHNQVSRFTADGNTAMAGSEVVILELDNQSGDNHNGGAIHFGADGKLYITAGENGTPANAQTTGNLHGKVLRINSDGTIPADNPFFGTASGRNRAIWALGFRNPFTFAVQPGTGRIFINDVGQDAVEEIDELVAGGNYGWPNCEGPCSPPNGSFRQPIFSYSHGGGDTRGFSIAGGAFYNPATNQFPASEVGVYFFADFVNGWIRKLDPGNGNQVTTFATGINRPVDLKVGADGRLYYLARGSGSVMAIQSSSVFANRVGSYNGLFYETNGVRHGASGFFGLTLRRDGGFTARLQQGTRKYSFTGRFDLEGNSTNVVKRTGTNHVAVELAMDPQGPGQITGRVFDTNSLWEATLIADHAMFNARTSPATNYAGSYTLLITGSTNTPAEPAGDGAGNFKIDAGGSVRLSANLADGSPAAQKAVISTNGAWPLYVSLYRGRGSLLGWITVTNSPEPDLGGLVSWFRPAGPSPKVHTNGFALESTLVGSLHRPPGTNTIFGPTNAIVTFSDGDLAESFTNNVGLIPRARVVNEGTNKLRLTLTQSSGRVSGSVTPPGMRKAVVFKGALLQKQGYGGGYFPGTNESGRVYFAP